MPRSGAEPWWRSGADPAFPVHVEHASAPIGADDDGNVKLVGFPIQREWTGSWRESTAEAARPKPNSMSTLNYTMQKTETHYVFDVRTHWELTRTRFDFELDDRSAPHYRPVGYIYVTGPKPKGKGNYPYDGPRGEKDLNRGRIVLPRGTDYARCAAGEWSVNVESVCRISVPRKCAEEGPDGASEGGALRPEETGLSKQLRAEQAVK